MLQFQLHSEVYRRWELLYPDRVIAAFGAAVSVSQVTSVQRD